MKKFLMLLLLFLAACGPVRPVATNAAPTSPATEVVSPTPLPTATLEVPPTPLPSSGGYPAAVFAAQAHLAAQLDLTVQQIQVTNIIPRDWPDSCLGAASADQICAAVITPGYEIVFSVGTAQYIYHTDLEGKNMRAVTGHTPQSGSAGAAMLFEWSGADCARLAVSSTAVLFGKCAGALVAVPGLSGSGAEPLKSWLKSFAPFEAQTPAGGLKFTGYGPGSAEYGKSLASPADQRMLAEWAKLQYAIAQSGSSGAAWGLAFSYHREGGIAGFCDDVAVYLDGHAQVSTCKGRDTTLYLTASEMSQVYTWFDDLRQIDFSQKDAAIADSMTVQLSMPAQGQKTADDATLSAILDYASTLTAQATFAQQAGPQVADAGLALVDYLKSLNSGDFALAARLYGGPTDLLQTWNPEIKNDLPAWLEQACKNNGLVCMLPRSVTHRGPDARGGEQFLVEFNNADGSLFVQGPCCGETSGPSTSRFLFSVLPAGNAWQVQDLPPYVP